MKNNAKIVYTIGPDTDSAGMLEQLVLGGMDVARCDFSHREGEEAIKRMDTVRQFHNKGDLPIAILMDISERAESGEQQREDILLGIREDVDYVSAPDLFTGDDARDMRRLLDENGGEEIRLIAKLADGIGAENLDSILEAADGVMVEGEAVPALRKMAMKKAFEAGKMLITATQMLDFHERRAQSAQCM